MSIDQTPAERAYARQERDRAAIMAGMGAGLSRWTEAMSATGRRAATSVAASKLRQWVNRTLGERPSRGELRAWFELVLDERHDLHNRLEQATRDLQAAREHAAVRGQGVAAKLDEVDGLRRELDAVLAQRDDALADASELRDRVWFLDEDRTRRTKERDLAEQNLDDRTVEMDRRYEELRAALEETIAERNQLARHNRTLRETVVALRLPRFGRASCSHPGVGGAE